MLPLGIVALSLLGGLEVVVGGIGQSFLNSYRLPDIVHALGHGVPAHVGIFSSGGGLLLDELLWREFPFSILAWGIDMGVCVTILLVLGWIQVWPLLTPYTLSWGWVFWSVAFVPLLTKGLVLGWADWFCWGWILDLGPNFPSSSR